MATEHRNITDAERHEAKGASSASAGQVLQANGDGTTSFVAPSTLNNLTIASTLEALSTTDQNPSGTDDPYQVLFGAGTSNADVNVASNGVITILNDGLYFVQFSLGFGRSTDTDTAILVSRLLINGTPTGFTQVVQIDAAVDIKPINVNIFRHFEANDTLTIEFIRDSDGTDNGGLRSVDPVLADWDATPSAAVRVQRLEGGF